MLLPLAKKRVVVHVPLLAFLATAIFGSVAVAGRVPLAAVVAVIALGLALSELRTAGVVDGRLVVASLFGKTTLDASASALGYRVVGSRYAAMEIYATDGRWERVPIGDGPRSSRKAAALIATLSQVLFAEAPRPDHAIVRADAEVIDAAEAAVNAYYVGPQWKRNGMLVAGLAALYLLVMVIGIYATGGSL